MAEQNATNLRQANTKVKVQGKLSEKVLEKKVVDGVNAIIGHLTLKTSDTNFVRFDINVKEKTKEGKDNSIYAGMKTIMEEYQSIADAGEEGADVVAVTNGNLNPYTGRDGVDRVGYKSNFFNRVNNPDDFNPHAEFEAEIFIQSIVPEIADEEETGRIIVNGWVPTYSGIEPIKLVADDATGAAVESMFLPNQTAEFYGEILNEKVVKVIEKPVVIGKPRKEIKTTYKNTLLITGVSPAYEEDSVVKPYDPEVIRAAIQERKNRMEERKNQSQSQTQNKQKPSGASRGRALF